MKMEIAEQENAISKNQAKAKLLVNQANSVMEETESMRAFLINEISSLEKAEKQIQKAIIFTGQKVLKKNNLIPVDNEIESDS